LGRDCTDGRRNEKVEMVEKFCSFGRVVKQGNDLGKRMVVTAFCCFALL
jgi:hypothetical protein